MHIKNDESFDTLLFYSNKFQILKIGEFVKSADFSYYKILRVLAVQLLQKLYRLNCYDGRNRLPKETKQYNLK